MHIPEMPKCRTVAPGPYIDGIRLTANQFAHYPPSPASCPVAFLNGKIETDDFETEHCHVYPAPPASPSLSSFCHLNCDRWSIERGQCAPTNVGGAQAFVPGMARHATLGKESVSVSCWNVY